MQLKDALHRPNSIFAALATMVLMVGLPATAPAQSSGDTAPDSFADWRACLDGESPSSTNHQPATAQERRAWRDGEIDAGHRILDVDPDTDEVLFDFEDHVSNDAIRAFGERHGLDFKLNSRFSDAPNLYIATVEEGAVPYIRDCLGPRAEQQGIDVESISENVLFHVAGRGYTAADDGARRSADSTTPSSDATASDDFDTSDAPNDPLYQFQWNFDQVDAEGAWDVSTGSDVVVAVVDTGVALEEDASRGIKPVRDLEGTDYVQGYDFVDDDEFAWDGHGHGTHVAGTIAQTTDNAYGVAGLAHDATIMPLRVLSPTGGGQISDIVDAIHYAADNDADVINMSLGGPIPTRPLKDAVEYAHNQGVTVIAAAGNSGSRSPSFPAAFPHVTAVSATQYDKDTTFYSQWGPFVDIAAPGGNVREDQNGDGRPDGVLQETLKDKDPADHDFIHFMGTSMASPHAAAGAALLMSQGITNPEKVESILQSTADTSQRERYESDKEFSERYGAGIMDASAAVTAAVNTTGGWRLAGGVGLLFLAVLGVRRRRFGAGDIDITPGLIGTTVMTSSGLFMLPGLLGDWFTGTALSAVARPLAEWDLLLFGADQIPLMASVLIPLAAMAVLAGRRRWRLAASGLAFGMAGFCLVESVVMTSDVLWIPGMAGWLDSAWLAVNGLLSFAIGYLGLKSD